jgi:hypothetical protein
LPVDFDFFLVFLCVVEGFCVVEDFDVVCELDFLGVEVFGVEVLGVDLCEVDWGSPAAPGPKELVSRKPSKTTV